MARRKPSAAPAPEPPPEAAPTAPLSARKRAAFTAAMLLLPVAFFLLLEGGLRLFGYGADYPLFVPVDGRPELLVPNREVARRYFAREAAVPNPNPDVFPAERGEGTFLIVAQGESSAAGYPFYRGASFPQVLGTRLRLAYPGRDVQVVNTGMAAISSYTLLDLADEIVAQRPDAVVIYAGHNEWYGALGAASTESLGRRPGVVRAYLRLRGLRTVQLLRHAVSALAARRAPPGRPSNTLMARMIGEQAVPLGSDVYEAGLRQFRSNLAALLARYRAAGIPVYVSTVASNERDQRPFVTAHAAEADTAAWRAATREGLTRMAEEDFPAAAAALERATALDPLAADAFFVLGHVYRSLGRADDAGRALLRARDLDALRFRAPSAVNAIIREEAARHGARLVEGEEALRRASPDGLVGRAMMLEHLHPTLDGYAALADAFFDALVADRRLGPAARPTPPGRVVRLVTPMDSLAGMIRVEELTASWPFRAEEAQPVRLDPERTPPFVVEQARRVLAGADWLEAADTLAAFYEAAGRYREALTARRAMVQAYPFLAETWNRLANLELRRVQREGLADRLPYVAGLYQEALARDPANVPALAMLGALALQAGDRPAAIGFLERARAAAPNTPQVLYNLSGAYLQEGRFADAIRLAEQLVAMQPGNPAYRALLAGLLRDAGAAPPD